MRVGMFTDTYVPESNGVVTVIQLMERELARAGHEVTVFAPSYPGHRETRGEVHRFPSFRMIWYEGMRIALPVTSPRVFRLIAGLDIAHSHDPFSVGQVAFWASYRYRIPHVHTYHTLYTEYRRYVPHPFRPSRRAVEQISRLFCNRCAAVVAPSKQMEQELRSYGVKAPIYPISYGVDEGDFDSPIAWDARRELDLPSEELLLFAGRLCLEKNVLFLLRAFQRIVQERPTARLVLAGDGPQRRQIEAYAAELGVAAETVFTGHLPRERLIDLYRQATLFVFASKTETQGLVLVEAMMAGLPVVAVGAMGPLDIVIPGETGMLVDEHEDQFATACLTLLSDEVQRKRLGEAARHWASARSARASTARLLQVYEEARARRSARRARAR